MSEVRDSKCWKIANVEVGSRKMMKFCLAKLSTHTHIDSQAWRGRVELLWSRLTIVLRLLQRRLIEAVAVQKSAKKTLEMECRDSVNLWLIKKERRSISWYRHRQQRNKSWTLPKCRQMRQWEHDGRSRRQWERGCTGGFKAVTRAEKGRRGAVGCGKGFDDAGDHRCWRLGMWWCWGGDQGDCLQEGWKMNIPIAQIIWEIRILERLDDDYLLTTFSRASVLVGVHSMLWLFWCWCCSGNAVWVS